MYSGTTVTGLETLSLRSNDFKDCLDRASAGQLARAITATEAHEESTSRESRLKKLREAMDKATTAASSYDGPPDEEVSSEESE